ncbi:MAG TPA: hypothetical protein VKG79_04535 [Bryobacteraceae bacterium]|nr:hypothetical protein [Bryobacteraceae bacterium]
MTRINLKLTAKELALLNSIVSDQLFRREFIDARLAGCESDAGALRLGKQLLERLRAAAARSAQAPPAGRKQSYVEAGASSKTSAVATRRRRG